MWQAEAASLLDRVHNFSKIAVSPDLFLHGASCGTCVRYRCIQVTFLFGNHIAMYYLGSHTLL